MYSATSLHDYVIRVHEQEMSTGQFVVGGLDQSGFTKEAVSRTNQMMAESEFVVAGNMLGLARVPNSLSQDNPLMALTYPANQMIVVIGRGSREFFYCEN